MKTSRYGLLSDKLNHSGINNNPIITGEELKELLELTNELIKVANDIEDKPLASYFRNNAEYIENVIDNRKFLFS